MWIWKDDNETVLSDDLAKLLEKNNDERQLNTKNVKT